ncbi:SWPV2-ORF014 [Shearwaterpox virus]|uniref:SWPV2-ORF014 n=1 Tax=Shearwaterpox virus TaxID=1974596 RepID=A0A1V0QFY6_CNPV|nr:SWPV2-ORF014 [Shearwaterpox virus]QRI42735.1 IL-10-like protein [Cheloniid poxvirus 1]QRM15647.1 il-10-like protein [Penguinpox virus 2]QRM15977.1 il-10-like protein [Albatrosspox virus]
MININILSLLILILSIYANAIIDTCYDDQERERTKSNSISSVTPEMCKGLKQLVSTKLKDARQKEKSVRDYFTSRDNDLDFMLLQGVKETHKKTCGCYVLYLLLSFYGKTIRDTIQSNKHKNLNTELTNLAVSVLSLEDLLEACGITCNPKKDSLLKRIEEYMKEHGDDAIYKVIGEIEFLFQAIEKHVY